MVAERTYEINPKIYVWSVRLFNSLRKALRVNIKMHYDDDQVARGDIFLFNHFARFETFIPQYLIYRESGVLCRSVAAASFFREGDVLSNYLVSLGAVPNDLPDLLPFLALEILHGRKVVVFPEGGMVKDRLVVDERGGYSVYSRRARARRKHHRGAAVLATGLAAFKTVIREAHARGDHRLVDRWADKLGFRSAEIIVAAAERPTTIIPANITFYPLRIDDNLLKRGVELVSKALSPRASEELLIEGNILLKNTDMDIRLGERMLPAQRWQWWERLLVRELGLRVAEFEDFFSLESFGGGVVNRIYGFGMQASVGRLRDDYMRRMYGGVTVNLSHLAATTINALVEVGSATCPVPEFRRTLYLSIKLLQREKGVHLHRGLRNPDAYAGILTGGASGLDQFLQSAESAALIAADRDQIVFLEKLHADHTFDQIRLENPIAVYANETAPILGVRRSVEEAIRGAGRLTPRDLAHLRFDDQLMAYGWARQFFTGPRFEEINNEETATESGEPFLHVDAATRDLGVVLVHGFLASPAEVRAFGDKLAGLGFPVMGVRLKGHGTSPWDLEERSWVDWRDSVREGCEIIRPFAERLCLVGFSTGAALSLLLASEHLPGLRGVAAVSTPMRFMNRNMIFVPLMHGANRLLGGVLQSDGIMPFRRNESEHPHINYRNVPLRGLYELRKLVDTLEEALARVQCPVVILQGTDDRVVDPVSAELLEEKLTGAERSVVMIPSQRHGILNEDIGATHETIVAFLDRLERQG
jgi:esterase/lipase